MSEEGLLDGVACSVGCIKISGVERLAVEVELELVELEDVLELELLPGKVGTKKGVVGYLRSCDGNFGVIKHSGGRDTTFLSEEPLFPLELVFVPVPEWLAVEFVLPNFAATTSG